MRWLGQIALGLTFAFCFQKGRDVAGLGAGRRRADVGSART